MTKDWQLMWSVRKKSDHDKNIQSLPKHKIDFTIKTKKCYCTTKCTFLSYVNRKKKL